MKLRYSPASPYVRKCLVLAHEAGLAGRLELVPTVTADPASGLAHDNPLGKIPALATDDGQILFDSPVICEYLDSLKGSGGTFLPPAGPARWTALRRQALADGILDASLLRRYESLRPADEQSAGWHDKQKSVVARALDALEAEAERLGDPAGPADIGRIAIACALGYLDFRFAADAWREGRPKLARWYAGFAKRASMAATVPKDMT
jgi:glutathione S-transferase